MGIFNKISNLMSSSNSNEARSEESHSSDIDLAECIFASFRLGTRSFPPHIEKQAQSIIDECNDRQSAINAAISLLDEPTTPRVRYLYAIMYAWSTAQHRQQAIKYLNYYLNNELYAKEYENSYVSAHNSCGMAYTSKQHHLLIMYDYLGKAYEGEYMLDEALEAYKKASEQAPFIAFPYCGVGSVLIKQGKLHEALDMYLSLTKKPFYKPIQYDAGLGLIRIDDDFKMVIDDKIEDVRKKIDKGYTYRPRKKQPDPPNTQLKK